MSETPLPSSGNSALDWAARAMPVLATTLAENAETFRGRHIGICLHIEPKTGVLVQRLLAVGARVTITGNLGTTDPATADALRGLGAEVIGDRSDDPARHAANLGRVLEAGPDLLLDNGAEMIQRLVLGGEKPAGFLGATEETTTGGRRLRELGTEADFPVIVINDSRLKLLVENEYGVGQSVVQGFMNATNTMLPGIRAAVIGFGPCGMGVAETLDRLGARVSVADPDPYRALEAIMRGHRVGATADVVADAQLVFLATGRPGVLGAAEIARLRDGAMLVGVGHEPEEADLGALREGARVRSLSAPGADPDARIAYGLPDGREIVVLHGTKMINLVAAGGNPIQAMDLGLALQAASLAAIARGEARFTGPHGVPEHIDRALATALVAEWSGA